MSEQSTQNPTPTVQVTEVGLQDQVSIGKVLAVAGVAAGAAAGLIALLSEKAEPEPVSRTETARQYLQSALEEAQKKDLDKKSRKRLKKMEKDLKQRTSRVSKDAEKLVKQSRSAAGDSANAVRDEVNSLMSSIRSGSVELDKMVEGFAESTLMTKLREFGDEAKVIAEQGKMRGSEAAHKAQDDLIPQVKEAADQALKSGKEHLAGFSEKAQDEFIPQAKEAADQVVKSGKEHLAEFADKAQKDLVPQVHKLSDEAREKLEHAGEDAEKRFQEAAATAEAKRKSATTAVQRGGRETRSLLLWVSLAGILIFTVFLDEDQQKKLKEVAFEVFGEARDMYTDMKGNTNA